MKSIDMFHVYWDQGGLLGKGVILITKEPIAVEENIEHHISWYYFGKLTAHGIGCILNTYSQLYPLPDSHKDSEVPLLVFSGSM